MKDEVIVSQADLTAEEEHLMKAEVINMTGLVTEGGLKDGKD